MKKAQMIFLCVLVLWTSVFAAAAADSGTNAGEARAVIGADLTEDQITQVYDSFGIRRGDVPELSVTNAEERIYLEGLAEDEIIGTRAISCIYVELSEPGTGLDIRTENLTWCTPDMLRSALATVGISDAAIVVTAPFSVSGTAALTGICKAYEDITGTALDKDASRTGTQELMITGRLADAIGSRDAVSIVSDIKLILSETKQMSDDELKRAIGHIAEEHGVSLTDSQIDQLITLCRGLEKLDVAALKEKAAQLQDSLDKISETKEKVTGFAANMKVVLQNISRFFSRILNFFGWSKN